MTPDARVEASFWGVVDVSDYSSIEEINAQTSDKIFAAKVALLPNDRKLFPFRIVFDFTPHLIHQQR